MTNTHLKTAELVRTHIDHVLPSNDVIDKEKLNINLKYMVDVSKDISADVPLSMAVIFGIYNMANFISQFQYRINLNGSKIPPNVVGFLLSKSGAGLNF